MQASAYPRRSPESDRSVAQEIQSHTLSTEKKKWQKGGSAESTFCSSLSGVQRLRCGAWLKSEEHICKMNKEERKKTKRRGNTNCREETSSCRLERRRQSRKQQKKKKTEKMREGGLSRFFLPALPLPLSVLCWPPQILCLGEVRACP